MRRTNIYLEDRQLDTLRRLGEQRGAPVSTLVRDAIDSWLESQGVRPMEGDEWERRFAELLARRAAVAEESAIQESEVERDVARALKEVREARAARRH